MNVKILSRFSILFASITTLAIVFILYHHNTASFIISHDSGIYNNAFELEISSSKEGVCYYTTDGTAPTPGAPGTYVYTEPLFITILDESTVYSFQFQYLYNDGTTSSIQTRDYIMDENASSRYTTRYIISVIGNEESLFSYENGIFVRGETFDNYLSLHPDTDLLSTVVPANYHSKAEFPVHVAFFSTNGTHLLSQDCGLKIYGNVTRAKNQKSFRLIARNNYAAKNEFEYPFFDQLYSESTNTTISQFQRLSIHNSGNDNYYAFLRNALIGELARQSGFPDVLVSESITVYINGRYQGVYWLQNTFDDRYFKEKYGNYSGEMVVCEGSLDYMNTDDPSTYEECTVANDYNLFVNTLADLDMNIDSNWQYVLDTLDINNFAHYMAIEYYINNIDWPSNNVKLYRYIPSSEERLIEDTVFDGRYRYLLFDTDYGLGLKFLDFFGYDAYEKRLDDLLSSDTPDTTLFRKLMEREEFKELFVNHVLSLLTQSFSPENIEAQMHDFNGKRYGELEFMVTQTQLMNQDLWENEPLTIDRIWEEMNEIVDYGKKRPEIVLSELEEVLNYALH